MSDPTPPPSTTPEKTVVVTNPQFNRLWYLTLASISLSLFILVLFAIGAVIHHHMMREMAGGKGPRGGPFYAQSQGDFGRRFGGMRHGGDWGRRGGRGSENFGGGRFGGRGFGHGKFAGGDGPGNNFGPGPGRRFGGGMGGGRGMGMMNGGGGMGSGPGMMGGGRGMGMMGGGRNGPPDPALMTDRMVNRLSRQLSMTDDQKARLKPVIEAQTTQMQKDMQAQRDAMQKSMDDTKAKIKALLTPDQQKQFDTMPMPGGPAARPGQ